MILFPAIDLKDGQCVRLLYGDMDQATVFNDNPAAQAAEFVRQGFEWLHLVDLNGAIEGEPVNGKAVEAVLQGLPIPVQLGGGIRDRETVSYLAGAGCPPSHPRHRSARRPGFGSQRLQGMAGPGRCIH